MADINAPSVIQITDANGNPVPGAKAYFYDTGTTTPRTVYSDAAGTVPHPSPVVADSGGFLPPIYVTATVKMNVTTSAGAAVPGYPVDPAARVNTVGSAASSTSYNPHASNAAINVQDAVDNINDLIGGNLTKIAGLTRTRGDLIRGGASAWEDLALGTIRQVVTSDGTDLVWGERMNLAALQNTTSGSTWDFTGIPAGVRKIIVNFNGMSLSGTDHILIQLGDSGGVEITGYNGSSINANMSSGTAGVNSAAGIPLAMGLASLTAYGTVEFTLADVATNLWTAFGAVMTNAASASFVGGAKALSAVLDRVRITVTGANTGDGGSVSIGYM